MKNKINLKLKTLVLAISCMASTLTLNLAAAETALMKSFNYAGPAKLDLTYYGSAWRDGKEEHNNSDDCRNPLLVAFTAAISLGYLPFSGCAQSAAKLQNLVRADLEVSLYVADTGNASLLLKSKEQKGCLGFSTTFLADRDSNGIYTLFIYDNNGSEGDKWSEDKRVGTAIASEKSIFLQFFDKPVFIKSIGKDSNTCLWQLGRGFNSVFKANDPSSGKSRESIQTNWPDQGQQSDTGQGFEFGFSGNE